MCFSAPKVTMPKVAELPTIKETTAPEPAAPVLGGGGVAAPEVSGTSKKTGVSALKVKPKMAAKAVATGANLALKPNM